MDIIVSHQLTDLDGLGAMIAASKLYPQAKPVFVGRLHRLVKDFMVLYRDELKVYRSKDIDFDEVKRVIIVDTYSRKRLGAIKDKIDWDKCEVIIYDHHPHDQLDWVSYDLSEEVGSATTILINKIVAEGIKLNPLEATLCALAIYADTGNLSYLNTKPSDARALSYLLEFGANLKVINQFIKEPLNEEQEGLLEDLLDNREDLHIDGIAISLFCIKYDKYIVGINRVVEQLKALYHLPSIFILVEMERQVELVGRSSDEAVNVGKICQQMGGGGHAGAGAAKVALPLAQSFEKVKGLIKMHVQPMLRVRKIMSSPVRIVTPAMSVEEVEDLLKKYGHNGVVVCQEQDIVGIFCRRDLEKIKGHGLMHAPVKAYMSKDVITIDADASVRQARELMVKYGVGRLPVVEGSKLVGIVTRSNILASYYGKETPYQHKNRYGSSLVTIKEDVTDISAQLKVMPAEILLILRTAGKIAASNYSEIYLIGGMVRDLMLGKFNDDLDFVVDGDLEHIIKSLAQELDCEWSYNEHFRTGSITTESGYNLDLATTRKEKYHFTGSLPEVESTDILEDLFRRDYTINALILDINPENWGILTDYFQGKNDLNNRLLRALHRFSFLDDPTRIIRGIRLAAKLDFDFEEETSSLINEALVMGDFSGLAPVRVIKELKLLFESKLNEKLIKLLTNLPVFNLLNLNLQNIDEYYQQASQLESLLEYYHEKNYNIKEWLLRFGLFMDDLSAEECVNWNIRGNDEKVLMAYQKYQALLDELNQDIDSVKIVELLSELQLETILLLLVKDQRELVQDNLKHYLENLSKVKLEINGFDLQEMGLQPGPEIRHILDQVLAAKLRGEITEKKEEIEYAASLIEAADWSDE